MGEKADWSAAERLSHQEAGFSFVDRGVLSAAAGGDAHWTGGSDWPRRFAPKIVDRQRQDLARN